MSVHWGIASGILNSIIDEIKENKKIKKIILFGSRAKGNYKKGSDIDIAIVGDEMSFDELNQLKVNINELMIPYYIDLIDFNKIERNEIREHIERVGQIIWQL